MFCGKCGHSIKEGSAFCGECGAPVRIKKRNVSASPSERFVKRVPSKDDISHTSAGIPKSVTGISEPYKHSGDPAENDKLIIHMGNKAPSPEMERDFAKYFSEAKNLTEE